MEGAVENRGLQLMFEESGMFCFRENRKTEIESEYSVQSTSYSVEFGVLFNVFVSHVGGEKV